MSVILKFASLRTPGSENLPALSLASDSDFQQRLAEGVNGERPTVEVKATATAFVESAFLRLADEVAHGPALVALVDRLQTGDLPTPERVAAEVREAVSGGDPASIATDAARARDSVLAAYLVPGGPDPATAVALTRGYALTAAVLAGPPTAEVVAALIRGPMALPPFALRLPAADQPLAPPQEPQVGAQALANHINALAARRQQLASALEHLSFHAEDELDLRELGDQQPLGALYDTVGRQEQPHRQEGEREVIRVSRDVQATSQGLRAAARHNVVLSARALDLMPEQVNQTLRDLNLDPASTSLRDLQNQATQEHKIAGGQITVLAGKLGSYANAGAAAHLIGGLALDPVDAPDVAPDANLAAPTTHTAIKPLGIADLLLVRAHLDHYERAGVAAIENVLADEKLTHTVRRLITTELTTTDDKESTDLRSQAQTTAESSTGHTTVQAIGPGVGPLAAEGASSFAKAVTDEVSSSSTNRARRLSTARQLNETEETFEHLIDNSAGARSTYGVYQWLDTVYQAQAFSYGSRLLYDVVVPEPAALFREALRRPRSGLPLPVKPARFTLAPSNLTLDNWDYYASGHHASGIDAPPPDQTIVTEAFAGKAKDQFSTDAATNTFVLSEARTTRIPKGYRAQKYRVRLQVSGYEAGLVEVAIGTKAFRIVPANGSYFRTGTLDGETDSLPVALHLTSDSVNWGVSDVTVSVEILCQATLELISAWQVRTHAQILDANRTRFTEYEQAVATCDASARIFLQGLPAARKPVIVQTEVKRVALELLTGQAFTSFNATSVDGAGFPYANAASTLALSAYVRFFEQAVEWDHLAYCFYPYFWGAQTSWVSKLLANEPDPGFADFLTSGAARVVLPIRPGYEGAFETFLNTGALPTTDKLLDVGSPLWVSLVAALRAQSNPQDQETPVDEPWSFRIASDLVRARPDGSMPKWALAQGTWHDAADPDF